MARVLTNHNPDGFAAASTQQAALIKERQDEVRAWCRAFCRDPAYARYTDAATIGSSPAGACWMLPIMMAKAAMVHVGRNVLEHWQQFRANMGVKAPREFLWEADPASWNNFGTQMEGAFHRIDFTGTLASAGRWTPTYVREMWLFRSGAITNEEALFWIGEIGGTMHHLQHPEDTLVNLPQTLSMNAGTLRVITPEALFGTPPYTPSIGDSAPVWATLNAAAIGKIFLNPSRASEQREYDVPVVMTDAVDEADEAIWKVTVTPPR